jgi:hypothetical protein
MGPPSNISYAYEHFQIELCGIGHLIQLHKCVAWSSFGLLLDFNTPSQLPPQFTTQSKGIQILGIPLGTSSFTLSFIKDVLLEDV